MTSSVLCKTGDDDDALLVLALAYPRYENVWDQLPSLPKKAKKGSVSHALHGWMDFTVRLSGSDPFGALENRLTSKTSYLSTG